MNNQDNSYNQGFSSAGREGIGFLPQAAENKWEYIKGFFACKADGISDYLRNLRNLFRFRSFEMGEGRTKRFPETSSANSIDSRV